jgi:hypothetical protein
MLAPRSTPKLEGRPLSAARVYVFHIFAATLRIEGRSSQRNLRTRHVLMTETPLSWRCIQLHIYNTYVGECVYIVIAKSMF